VDAEKEVLQAIGFLEHKEYLFWGNDRAVSCDFVFVHSQDDSTVRGILRVRDVRDRSKISEEEFLSHEPSAWGRKMTYKRYFVVEKAKAVNIPREVLKNMEGNPIKVMHDMNFVTSERFEPF